MIVLGIESTCDETAAAIISGQKKILSTVVSSQVDQHQIYGGVVPELASRRHTELLIPVIDQALTEASVKLKDINLIAVAMGPGLIGPLMIGVNAAKALAWAYNIPWVGVNHIEAHLYAAWMSADTLTWPAIGVVLSGGHTSLVLMRELGDYVPISATVDDAVGEAFDKVAKVLGLPYPGGPEIEKLAKKGSKERFSLSPGRVKGHPLFFSFSGLKTSVLYAAKGPKANKESPLLLNEQEKADLAASFQEVAFKDIVNKTLLAAKQFNCQSILLGGGVTCNERLRELFAENGPNLKYFWPSKGLSLDNAAMIAGLGSEQYKKQGKSAELNLEPLSMMPFQGIFDV